MLLGHGVKVASNYFTQCSLHFVLPNVEARTAANETIREVITILLGSMKPKHLGATVYSDVQNLNILHQ